jgi:hypothetical protein
MAVRIADFEITSLLRVPAGCVLMPAAFPGMWITPAAAIGRSDRVKQSIRFVGKIPLSARSTPSGKLWRLGRFLMSRFRSKILGEAELHAGRPQAGPEARAGDEPT